MPVCALFAEPQRVDPEVRAALGRSQDVNVVVVLRTQPDRALVQAARAPFESRAGSNAEETEARGAAARRVDELCATERNAFADRLVGLGATRIRTYRAVNAVAARIPASALAALERDEAVRFVGLDGVLQAQLDVSAVALGATAFRDVGLTGTGQSIALIDSGVDTTHPALAEAKIIHGPVFSSGWMLPHSDNPNSPDDYSATGHGTQMAGILVGQGSPGFPGHLGIARGATLYNLKAAYVTTSNGVSFVQMSFSSMLAALDYAVLHTPAKIVNISYGAGAFSTSSSAAAASLVDQIADVYDVSIVMGFPNALEPAGSVNAIVVGAMDDRNTTSRVDDTIAPTTPHPGVTRFPDLTAPGVNIMAPTNQWEGAKPDYLPVAGVTTYVPVGVGTSLGVPSASAAAAHVSGAVALLRQSGITDALLVKAVLINSTDGEVWTSNGGWGYLDLWKAKEPGIYYPSEGLTPSSSHAFAGPVDSGPLRVTLVTQGSWGSWLVISDRKTGKRVFQGSAFSRGVKVTLPTGYYLIQVDNQTNGGRWALAISRRGFEPVSVSRVGGDHPVKFECFGNATVALGSKFAVTCTVANPWDIEAPAVTGRVFAHYPGEVDTTGCMIPFGTVPGHGSRTLSCLMDALHPGPQLACADLRQGGEYHDPDPEYKENTTACYSMTVTGGGITGNVMTGGTPVEGVLMTLSGPVPRVVRTNAKGDFGFYELQPGSGPYTVTPSKTGYMFQPASAVVPSVPANSVPHLSFGTQSLVLTGGGLRVVWNSGIQKEAIVGLSWRGGPNLTNTVYLDTCGPGGNGNVEYFGNSMSPPDPQAGGKVLVGGETDPGVSAWAAYGSVSTEIRSMSKNCAPSSGGVPVVTRYNVGRFPDLLEVERTFRFDQAAISLPNGLRPYVPRLRMDSGYTAVLYPATDGTLASVSAYDCHFGCSVLPKPWASAKGWFAIHNPGTGQGVIVSRSRANDGSRFTAELWVDWDMGSASNATSFLLKSSTGGFSGSSFTEKQSFYFYDASTWTPSVVTPPVVWP